MPALFAEGDRYIDELDKLKSDSKEAKAKGGMQKKRRAGEALRDTQPW